MNKKEKREKFFEALALIKESCFHEIDKVYIEAQNKIDAFLESKKKSKK